MKDRSVKDCFWIEEYLRNKIRSMVDAATSSLILFDGKRKREALMAGGEEIPRFEGMNLFIRSLGLCKIRINYQNLLAGMISHVIDSI